MPKKQKEASSYLGGLSGKAAQAFRTRGDRLKEMEAKAMGYTAPQKKKKDKNGY